MSSSLDDAAASSRISDRGRTQDDVNDDDDDDDREEGDVAVVADVNVDVVVVTVKDRASEARSRTTVAVNTDVVDGDFIFGPFYLIEMTRWG